MCYSLFGTKFIVTQILQINVSNTIINTSLVHVTAQCHSTRTAEQAHGEREQMSDDFKLMFKYVLTILTLIQIQAYGFIVCEYVQS